MERASPRASACRTPLARRRAGSATPSDSGRNQEHGPSSMFPTWHERREPPARRMIPRPRSHQSGASRLLRPRGPALHPAATVSREYVAARATPARRRHDPVYATNCRAACSAMTASPPITSAPLREPPPAAGSRSGRQRHPSPQEPRGCARAGRLRRLACGVHAEGRRVDERRSAERQVGCRGEPVLTGESGPVSRRCAREP